MARLVSWIWSGHSQQSLVASVIISLLWAVCPTAAVRSSGAEGMASPWSSWSSCSAPCGPGLSSRQRHCLSTGQQTHSQLDKDGGCQVLTSQARTCQTKACSGKEFSVRGSSCSKYNDKVFSGQLYEWEPYIHPTAPCKLSCRAKGSNLYANLADRVPDGALCGAGLARESAVCVSGVCQTVGCDGVVGSGMVPDKCGRCHGDNSTCQTVSGIFTSTQLERGLNHVINIPAGSTGINITELSPSRNLLLLQTLGGKTFITNGSRPASGDIPAAGTVFQYGRRTPSTPLQRISAVGPINVTVVLKLLSRGFNPGIMYSFNVPKGSGDGFLREITQRSDPQPPIDLAERTKQHERDDTQVSDLDSHQSDEAISQSDESFVGNIDHSDKALFQKDNPRAPDQEELPTRKIRIVDNPMYLPSEMQDIRQSYDPKNADFVYKKSDIVQQKAYSHSEDNSRTLVDVNGDTDDENDKVDRTDIDDEEIKEIMKDHEQSYSNEEDDALLTTEQLISEGTKQTATVRLESGIDPSEIGGWTENKHSPTRPHVNPDRTRTNDQTSRVRPLRVSDSEDRSELQPQRPPSPATGNGAYPYPRVRTESRIPVTVEKSGYKIPKYSQSFTFGERYRNVYAKNLNTRRHNAYDRRPWSRQSIDSYPNNFDSESSSFESDRLLGRNSLRRPIRIQPAPVPVSTGGRGDEISALDAESVPKTKPSSRSRFTAIRDSNRRNILKEVARQRRLRDRQTFLDDRQRRLREQRRQYRRRLKDYQNQLTRQRSRSSKPPQVSRANSEQRTTLSNPPSVPVRNNKGVVVDNPVRGAVLDAESSLLNEIPETSTHLRKQVSSTREESTSSVTTGGVSTLRVRTAESTGESTRKDVDVEPIEEETSPGNTAFNTRPISTLPHPVEIKPESNPPQREDHTGTFSKTHGVTQPDLGSNTPNNTVSTESQQIHPTPQPPVDEISTFRQDTPPPRRVPNRYPQRPDVIPSQRSTKRKLPDPLSIPRVSRRRPGVPSQLHRGTDPQGLDLSREVQASVSGYNSGSGVPAAVDLIPRTKAAVLPNQIPRNTVTSEDVLRTALYEWRISGLSECTQSCGGGLQQTMVVCVDTASQATVTDDNCLHLDKPKRLSVKCNTRPCPAAWTPGPWGPCSVTCGEGQQVRPVLCQARVSPTLTLTMEADSCQDPAPLDTQACLTTACSSWSVGNWSQCSAGCGEGVQTRDVQCVGQDGAVLEDSSCTQLKPDSQTPCDQGPCGKGWFFTDWPETCPVECGAGQKLRDVFCAGDGGEVLPAERCDQSHRPRTKQTCQADRPCGGHWFLEAWSKCNATCGPGFTSRDVLCIKSLKGGIFAVVGEENCAGEEKPSEFQPCLVAECPSQWFMTSWTECSQSCGTGYRTREVKCLNPQQQRSDSCSLKDRPRTRDPCNTDSCDSVHTSSPPEPASGSGPKCRDKFAQCDIVKRTRLCRFKYYQKACCASCTQGTRK